MRGVRLKVREERGGRWADETGISRPLGLWFLLRVTRV